MISCVTPGRSPPLKCHFLPCEIPGWSCCDKHVPLGAVGPAPRAFKPIWMPTCQEMRNAAFAPI